MEFLEIQVERISRNTKAQTQALSDGGGRVRADKEVTTADALTGPYYTLESKVENTFENTQWRKVKQRQTLSLACITP